MQTPNGKILRPRDRVPVNGLKAHDLAVKAIRSFAQQVKGHVPDLTSCLPTSLFPETGGDVKFVQTLVKRVSHMIYVRIVDKGPGEIWGFCRAWVWESVIEFLKAEGYRETKDTKKGSQRSRSHGSAHGRKGVAKERASKRLQTVFDWEGEGIAEGDVVMEANSS